MILLSFAKFKVRVLQAYFENGRLKIQKTDAIEFGRENQIEELKTVLSWRLCQLVGKTEWEKPVESMFPQKLTTKRKVEIQSSV